MTGSVLGIVTTGRTWLRVPHTIRVEVDGQLQHGVTAKDLILTIIGDRGMDGGLYQVLEFVGSGIEALSIEAACASGAAAVRQGYIAVASGLLDSVIVCGVEKMTEEVGSNATAALAMAGDAEYEVIHGPSFVSLNALAVFDPVGGKPHEFIFSTVYFEPTKISKR